MEKGDYISTILRSKQTVLSAKDIMLLWGEPTSDAARVRINYYAKNGDLYRIRRGYYSKDKNYNKFELATKIFTPSYVSFETVKTHVAHILKKTGAKNRAAAAVCLIRARRGKSPGPLPLKDAFSSSTIAAEGGVDYEASPRVSNETTYLVRSDDERGK